MAGKSAIRLQKNLNYVLAKFGVFSIFLYLCIVKKTLGAHTFNNKSEVFLRDYRIAKAGQHQLTGITRLVVIEEREQQPFSPTAGSSLRFRHLYHDTSSCWR